MADESKVKEIVSIDLGSTNSQIGVRYYDAQTGAELDEKDNIEYYLLHDKPGTTNIPTALLECVSDKAPEGFEECKGNYAFEKAGNYQKGTVVIKTDFKKDLFYTEGDYARDNSIKDRFKTAAQYTTEFLKYLKEVKEKNKSAYANAEQEVILTVPVRSSLQDRENMVNFAKKAGWQNVTIRDEATSALNYAIFMPDSPIMAKLQNSTATASGQSHVLLIDIGGSTTDILHAKVGPDGKGGYTLETFSKWPNTGEMDTLGMIEIDKKVCELMLERGYLLDDLVDNDIALFSYENFRKFKELWSDCAKKDTEVPGLSGLEKLTYNIGKGGVVVAKTIYDYEPKKLGREEFTVLTKEYIEKLQKAIRKVLTSDSVKESDVDFIILGGGGSKMYGIKEMLTADLKNVSNPLALTKIISDPSRVITVNGDNPSAMCCMGNLVQPKNIKCKAHIDGSYWLDVDPFVGYADDLIGTCTSLEIAEKQRAGLPKNAHVQSKSLRGKQLTNASSQLPIKTEFSETFKNLPIKTGQKFGFRLTVKKEIEGVKYIQYSWLVLSDRSLSKTIVDKWKKWLGEEETVYVDAKLTVSFSMDENGRIRVDPEFSAPGFGFGGGWGAKEFG